jgi:phosphoglycerate dehydrogenase-like enzyme
MRVAIMEPLNPPADEICRDLMKAHQVTVAPAAGQPPDGLAAAEAVVWSSWPVDRAFIAGLPNLRLLQRIGRLRARGDVSGAQERGVPVSVFPHGTSLRVAEHTFALILGMLRGLLPSHQAVVEGQNPAGMTPEVRNGPTPTVNWARVPGLQTLQYATVSIVGFGEIGATLALMLKPHHCRVLYHKRGRLTPEQERYYGVQYAGFDDALAQADVVCDLLPVSDATRGAFNAGAFGRMKPTAVLVNTGRAHSVDEAALLTALRDRRIAGAALDVFWLEPLPAGHPVTALPNVLLTPHTAGGTPQGAINGLAGWTDVFGRLNENLRRVAAGEPVLSPLPPDEPQLG